MIVPVEVKHDRAWQITRLIHEGYFMLYYVLSMCFVLDTADFFVRKSPTSDSTYFRSSGLSVKPKQKTTVRAKDRRGVTVVGPPTIKSGNGEE